MPRLICSEYSLFIKKALFVLYYFVILRNFVFYTVLYYQAER